MKTLSDANAMVVPHLKNDYCVETVRNHDFTTVYLISHKNRAVGAVSVSDDGELTIADDPNNANQWYCSDHGKIL